MKQMKVDKGVTERVGHELPVTRPDVGHEESSVRSHSLWQREKK